MNAVLPNMTSKLFAAQMCQIPQEVREGMDSELESDFAMRWEEKFPQYKLQHHFRLVPRPGTLDDTRRKSSRSKGKRKPFEVDFAHHESGTIIEINGGTWTEERSGHSTGKGLASDYEKLILAAEVGYQILFLDCKMTDTGKMHEDWLDNVASVIELRLRTVTILPFENEYRRIARAHYPPIYTAEYVDNKYPSHRV